MFEHTPGPWHVHHDPGFKGSIVQRQDEGGFKVIGSCEKREQADANLIGAAPEMYDALEWLVNVGHGVGKSGGSPTDNEIHEAIDAGHAALMKARGK